MIGEAVVPDGGETTSVELLEAMVLALSDLPDHHYHTASQNILVVLISSALAGVLAVLWIPQTSLLMYKTNKPFDQCTLLYTFAGQA
jgi:hypothetical protein